MTFKEVKVKSVDDKSPYVYPSRAVEIVMSKKVTTPTRAATVTEYNHKTIVPTEIPIENEISISVSRLNFGKLDSFLHRNGAYNKLLQSLSANNDMMKYSAFRAHIIQPTTSPSIEIADDGSEIEIPSAVDYLVSNPQKLEQFLRFVIKIQADLGFEIISIPYLALPFSDYSELIMRVTKDVRALGKEPMFAFDLGYANRSDKFGGAIEFFIDKADVKLLSFAHKSFANFAAPYDILSRYVRKDVAFISTDVPRKERSNALSLMHQLPFLGNDIYSVASPKWIPPKKKPGQDGAGKDNVKEEKPEIKKEDIRFFNPNSLVVQPSADRMTEPKQILNEIQESNNIRLLRIMEDYPAMGKDDQDKLEVLRSVSKVHELKSSTQAFSAVQKRIKSNESAEYVKEHSILDANLKKLKDKRKKRS